MRLLVVDDSTSLRELLVNAFERDNHHVLTARSASEADEALRRGLIDLVVLDLELPDESGVSWCQRVRREGFREMILVLTAHSHIDQRLEVFRAGADDFLAKPFALAELRARVRALGRRRVGRLTTLLRHGDVEADLAARRASKDGAEVPLTAREWSVLECLSSNPGQLVPRAQILHQLWGGATKYSSNSLEVLVGRIRRKLGPEWIRTMRNEGYSLGRELELATPTRHELPGHTGS